MFAQIILSSTIYVITLVSIMVINLSGVTFTSMAELERVKGGHHLVINHTTIFEFSASISAFAQVFLTETLVE